jgi:hypothetical protein
VKIKDPKTGEERDETDDERKAREDKAREDAAAADADIEKVKADRDKWKTEARKWEDRAKENSGAAAELKKLQDASKSEEQKRSDDKKAAEDRAAKAETDLVRLRIATRKGLTEAQARRLVGTTEEELEKDADELLKSFKPNEEPAGNGVTRRPRESMRPGTGGNAEPAVDVKKVVDEAMASGR